MAESRAQLLILDIGIMLCILVLIFVSSRLSWLMLSSAALLVKVNLAA